MSTSSDCVHQASTHREDKQRSKRKQGPAKNNENKPLLPHRLVTSHSGAIPSISRRINPHSPRDGGMTPQNKHIREKKTVSQKKQQTLNSTPQSSMDFRSLPRSKSSCSARTEYVGFRTALPLLQRPEIVFHRSQLSEGCLKRAFRRN